MLSLNVSLRVKPEAREEFLAAITQQARSTITDEPGCVRFDVLENSAEPNHFVFYEVYRDEAALDAHRAAPHFATWREAAGRTVVEGSQVNTIGEILLTLEDRS